MKTKEQQSKIAGLVIRNFKRLKLVELDFTSRDSVIISGANRAGKSSIIDALHTALKGKKYWKQEIERPRNKDIEDGETCEIIVTTDKYIIRRWFTSNEQDYITVTPADNPDAKFNSPESLLSEMYSDFSQDPLKIAELSEADQTEFLLQMIGLKKRLDELDAQRQKHYDDRAEYNREVKRLKGVVDSYDEEKLKDLPPKKDTSELVNELNKKRTHNEMVSQQKKELEGLPKKITEAEQEVERLRQELEDAEDDLEGLEDRKEQLENKEFVVHDLEAVQEQINRQDEISELHRKSKELNGAKVDLDDYERKSENETASMEEIDQQKTELLNKAKMPIKGMRISDNKVYLEDTPVKDLSHSEAIIFWSKVFVASKPNLAFLTIDNAESLDKKSRAHIEQFAQQSGVLFLMNVVDDSGELGLVIEDGQVTKNNYTGTVADITANRNQPETLSQNKYTNESK